MDKCCAKMSIWTSTINGFILCLCIEKNKTKQTRTSTYTQSECNVLIAIFECCCWSLLQALLIFLSSSLLSFRFQRGILYALATADARNARQTKMNLVLFQGECGNKNIVCTNWIFTCIVWFGRSERRIRKRQKNTTEMRLQSIHKFFVWSSRCDRLRKCCSIKK